MIERLAWLVLALVHLPPAFALVRPSLLGRLYGVTAESPLFMLMQHRAALFVAIVAICVWAAIDAAPRPLAATAVAISMVSFFLLYWLAGAPVALREIAIVDLIGLPALLFVAWRAFAG